MQACRLRILVRDFEVDENDIREVQIDVFVGATHHGRPMEIIPLGKTDLPLEVILEYLESLKQVYTAEVGSLEKMDTRSSKS